MRLSARVEWLILAEEILKGNMIWKLMAMMFARHAASVISGALLALTASKHGWIFGDAFKSFGFSPENTDTITTFVSYAISLIPGGIAWFASYRKTHTHFTVGEFFKDAIAQVNTVELKTKAQAYSPQIQAAVTAIVEDGLERATAVKAVPVYQPVSASPGVLDQTPPPKP